jgi:hypothetical protein
MFGEGLGRTRAPRHLLVDGAARPVVTEPIEPTEVPPLARVHRSRFAFAAAISLAAVPLLVIDNLPATAETNEVAVQATAGEERVSSSSAIVTSESAAESSTTTEAPATTAAPTTTAAPASTEAPAVQALAAPAPTAPPTTAAPATTAPPPSSSPGDPDDPETWDRLAACESGGRWSLNSGNGYYGGLQFSLASWRDVGGAGYPHQASKAEQVKRGKILQARYGWGQWPHCSRQLGYR